MKSLRKVLRFIQAVEEGKEGKEEEERGEGGIEERVATQTVGQLGIDGHKDDRSGGDTPHL